MRSLREMQSKNHIAKLLKLGIRSLLESINRLLKITDLLRRMMETMRRNHINILRKITMNEGISHI